MFVSQILDEKGREVITIPHQMLVIDACSTLGQHKIGAVVVVNEEKKILGILSERDIVRALNSSGKDALDKGVDELMTRDVVFCSEHDSIDVVMGKMSAGRFRHLPVVEEGQLKGLISIGDVVKNKIAIAEQEAEQIKSYISSA